MAEKNKTDRWWIPLVVGLIAFVGSSLGAAVPRVLFESEEAKRNLLDARLDAYNDFFKGQAKQKLVAQLLHDKKESEATKAREEYFALVDDARFRIGAYGTQSEINAITDYFRKYLPSPPCGDPRQKWLDDIKIYQRIREGVFRGKSSEQVEDARMIVLLFDCELPD
jgi:hypothetical protein